MTTSGSISLSREYVHTCTDDQLDSYFILPDPKGIHGEYCGQGWNKTEEKDLIDPERQVMPDRFRGFVHNDTLKCDACNICAKLCPVDCIYIETEGKGKERMMTRYAIDYNKCIWCSLCTEHCPTDCITMSHDYDHAVYKRERLVYEFVDEPVVPYKPPKPEKKTPAEGGAES